MTTVDDLWFLADEAGQRAERAYHRLAEAHGEFMEIPRTRRVSRRRFRTLARRVKESGAPFGAHTIVRRSAGELLLVRHEGVDMWVLPGGGVDAGESFRETAERELAEEAGVGADYEGLAMIARVDIRCDDHATWGVLPVFAARVPPGEEPTADDPEGEISAAGWFPFEDLPADTRDRQDLLAWHRRRATGD